MFRSAADVTACHVSSQLLKSQDRRTQRSDAYIGIADRQTPQYLETDRRTSLPSSRYIPAPRASHRLSIPTIAYLFCVSPAIMSLTNCRFYEEKFPEIDSFVMVNVKQVSLFCVLLSYPVLTAPLLDRRDGRIRQAPRVRQHRRHDPALRTFAKTYPQYPEAYPRRPERGCRCSACGQGEG